MFTSAKDHGRVGKVKENRTIIGVLLTFISVGSAYVSLVIRFIRLSVETTLQTAYVFKLHSIVKSYD